MYPNLYYLVREWFGLNFPPLQLMNTFGFFVALAFVGAAYVLYFELKRKEGLGQFQPFEEQVEIGKPATMVDLLTSFLVGFLFGFKIVGAFILDNALSNSQAFILSTQGSWPAGIVMGIILAILKYRELDKQKLDQPEIKVFKVWPHQKVGDFVLVAALWGFIGAKIFHNLENLSDFAKDPIGALISFSGLTFYGGLIIATIAMIVYIRKRNIRIIHFADAMAPTMLFAYAAGRVGCHMSGDGDWGIVNLHAKPFSWLPDWAWAYTYPHNVVQEGVRMPDCVGNYCNALPVPVYPTALYEIIFTFILFLILWSVRKKITQPGIITGVYFLFAGGERFLIEKIRVNNKYTDLPFQPTQAELISVILLIAGVVFLVQSKKWFPIHTQNNKL